MTPIAQISVQEAKTHRDACQKRVDHLSKQSTGLSKQIAAAADQARSGQSVTSDLNSVSRQKSKIDLELSAAKDALSDAEQRFEQLTFNEIANSFHKALHDARAAQAEVAGAVKTACLQLGLCVKALDRARNTHNEITARNGFAPTAAAELRRLDLANFCANLVERIVVEENLTHDMGTGWRIIIELRPLHPKN